MPPTREVLQISPRQPSPPVCGFCSTGQEEDKIVSLTSIAPSVAPSKNRPETISPPPAPKKKALLIGIKNYDSPEQNDTALEDGQLKGPHADVLAMLQLLLDCYDYNPDDITLLIDDFNPKHTQPTEENMIQSMKDLVTDARSGDQFYFHFSGHGTQVTDDNADEEDGWDECLLSCDNKIIRDDLLNQILVAPLPVGSTFVSVFDACHSGTVLDLKHYRCNRVYIPWVNKGVRRTVFLRNIVTRQQTQISVASDSSDSSDKDNSDNSDAVPGAVIQFSEEPAITESSIIPPEGALVQAPNLSQLVQPTLSITTLLIPKNWVGSSAVSLENPVSPQPIYCTGNCREDPEDDAEPVADVVSLSATKDRQLSWEDSHGSSLTKALIDVLREDPHSSLKHILTIISHKLHDFYVQELHKKSRDYKMHMKNANMKREKQGKGPKKGRTVEMDNFQDPQLSSLHPLDMDRPWPL